MTMKTVLPRTALGLSTMLLLAACSDVTPTATGIGESSPPTSGAPLVAEAASVPVTLDYRVVGNPVVGKAVGIEIQVDTPVTDRPVDLEFRVPEANSITFPEAQPQSVQVVSLAGAELRPQTVNVIPQRDGRVFLTVTARLETDKGAVRKSMSVPLQVARAPLEEVESGADQ